MKKSFWYYVTHFASYLTNSPINQDVPQQPLLGGEAEVIVIHDEVNTDNVVAPAVSNGIGTLGYPIFKPPSGRTHWEGSDFQCSYPEMVGYEPCSTPQNRSCWLRHKITGHAYDSKTNYENEAPEGIMRNYTLVVEDGVWNADGLLAKDVKLVNGTYPGPWIQGCWGDTLNIKVINKLKNNGTAVHFHGIRQNQTMHMDGVPGITQCPIAPNDYFVYKFKVTQYGSSWYHSHYSVQYADGLLGPMTLHGPATDLWDEPKLPILMSDWFHNSAFSVIHGKTPGYPTVLLNGTGDITKHEYSYKDKLNNTVKYKVTPNAPIPAKYQLHFEKGKRYLLRLINTSFTTTFTFSIDHHRLIIIGADFVPIEPVKRTHVQIGIGQRYTVIVEANPEVSGHINDPDWPYGDFWIRTTVADCFGQSTIGVGDYAKTGIVRYNPNSVRDPSTDSWYNVNSSCTDETGLTPWLPWKVEAPANGKLYGEEFGARFNKAGPTKKFPLGKWAFEADGTEGPWTPLQIDYDNPFFLHLNEVNRTDWPKQWMVIPANYTDKDWVYLAITGLNQRSNSSKGIVAHPIHLHGHDFAVLQQEYNATFPPKQFNLNLDNPMRRDVVLLPKNGWVVIAFKADNPGSWIMHCHIAFHASEGLALQINERQARANEIWPNNNKDGVFDSEIIEAKRVCKRWMDFQHDCTQHWPGKDEKNNCWPACKFKDPKERIYACPESDDTHVFQDDSGI